jgi:hypothetical protein
LAEDTWLRRQSRNDGALAFYWAASAGGDLVAEHRALFRRATEDCAPKLDRASLAGYETHLLIEPFWLGTQSTWRMAFNALADDGCVSGSHAIWVVSLHDRVVVQMC